MRVLPRPELDPVVLVPAPTVLEALDEAVPPAELELALFAVAESPAELLVEPEVPVEPDVLVEFEPPAELELADEDFALVRPLHGGPQRPRSAFSASV